MALWLGHARQFEVGLLAWLAVHALVVCEDDPPL